MIWEKQFLKLNKIKKMKFNLPLILITLFTSCDFIYKNNGSAGSSETKEEAVKNGSEVFLYLPDKNKFELIEGTSLTIDTAWTEVSFFYKNGNRVYDSSWGYIFNVPYEKELPENFTFNFSLLDTTNQGFTNGLRRGKCELRPIKLKDEMAIILKQKNPKEGVGWKSPIITDTITFKQINEVNTNE